MAIVRLRGGGTPGYGNRNGNAPNTTGSTIIMLVRAQAYADYGCFMSLNTGTAGGISGISSGGVLFISHTTAGSANIWSDGFTGWTWLTIRWTSGTMESFYQRLSGGDTTFHTGPTLSSADLTSTTDLTFGSDIGISGILDEFVDVASIKVFNSSLSTAQIQARSVTRLIEPGLSSGLLFHATCLSSSDFATDRSGTGDLTITGTVTASSDDPGVPYTLSAAALTTTATVTGTVGGGTALAATPSTTATLAGALGHTLGAAPSTTATVSATVSGNTALEADASTTASVSGALDGRTALEAGLDTTATVEGELDATGALESELATTATITGAFDEAQDNLDAALSTTASISATAGAIVSISASLSTTAGLTLNNGNDDDYYPSPDVDEAVKSPYPPNYIPDPDEPEYINDPPDGR